MLENHNGAIAYYLPRGVHFVVLTSIEEGNITQSNYLCKSATKDFMDGSHRFGYSRG